MLYVKKPVVVEAKQFTKETKDRVFAWCAEIQGNVFPSFDKNNKPILIIPTLEGEMTCSLGDYIVKEPFPTDWRKLYPVKREIFEQTYENSNIKYSYFISYSYGEKEPVYYCSSTPHGDNPTSKELSEHTHKLYPDAVWHRISKEEFDKHA